MSKVTYLLGAGASIGDWGDNNIQIKEKRGVPIISKFDDSISFIVTELSVLKNPLNAHIGMSNLDTSQLNYLHSVFSELLQICNEYHTIDTYARQLNVSHRSDYNIINNYDTLKGLSQHFFF